MNTPPSAPPEASPLATLPDAVTPPDDANQEATNARVAGATGILALGNILSRVLGLVRETVLSFLFGAGVAVDAFNVAIIVPKAIYDLLIGGHINGAIVPVLSDIVTLKGRDELWRVVSILTSLVTVLLIGIVGLIQIFAPQIVQVAAGGATATTLTLATDLLRLTSAALLFLGLFAILSGTLYALRTFTLPAFAGVIFNGSIVIVTLLFVPANAVLLAPEWSYTMPIHIARPTESVVIVALGWFIGAVAQMLLQFPGLRGARLRLTLDWRHPVLGQVALLYAPVMLSLIMDTLIIRPFSYNLASQTGEGSISYMAWATTLIQFPQGLVATAISVAILPMLSSQAALMTEQMAHAFKQTLGLGLRLATTLIIPATIGLFVMAVPIVQLIFERGAFTPDMTQTTALALRLYLIGLPFAAIDLLLVYAFYARKDTLTPALVGVLSLIIYIITAVALLETYGLFSLMIADSVKHFVHASISAVLLRRRLGGFGEQRLITTTLKVALASLVMGVVAFILLDPILLVTQGAGLLGQALVVVVIGGVASVVYFLLAYGLGVGELRWLVSLLRRKLA